MNCETIRFANIVLTPKYAVFRQNGDFYEENLI